MVVGKLSTAAFTRFNIVHQKVVPSKSVLPMFVESKSVLPTFVESKNVCPTFVGSKNVCPTFVDMNAALSSPEILASPFRWSLPTPVTCSTQAAPVIRLEKSNQGVWLKFWNKVKLKICKTRQGFEEFAHAEAASQCCSTNFFNPQATRSVLRFLWYYLFDVEYHIPLIVI